jgi:hypothetical protein
LPADGFFVLREDASAEYRTRIVVRRPSAADFNGTVVVEWLNVSGGLDANPDFVYLADELYRGGYAWVGVSAQRLGIEGGPVLISTPVSADAGAGSGLRALDPERYGELHHPGDAFALVNSLLVGARHANAANAIRERRGGASSQKRSRLRARLRSATRVAEADHASHLPGLGQPAVRKTPLVLAQLRKRLAGSTRAQRGVRLAEQAHFFVDHIRRRSAGLR